MGDWNITVRVGLPSGVYDVGQHEPGIPGLSFGSIAVVAWIMLKMGRCRPGKGGAIDGEGEGHRSGNGVAVRRSSCRGSRGAGSALVIGTAGRGHDQGQ